MTGYSPTKDPITEDVLRCFVCFREEITTEQAESQFYRWLAQVQAEAFDDGIEAHRKYEYPENPYRGEE